MSIKRFSDGALVWVKLSTKEPRVAGVVLASSDVSTREHGSMNYSKLSYRRRCAV